MSLATDIHRLLPYITQPPWKVTPKIRNCTITIDRPYGGAVIAVCEHADPKPNAAFLTLLGNHAYRIATLIETATTFEVFVRGQYGGPWQGEGADAMDAAHQELIDALVAVGVDIATAGRLPINPPERTPA